MEFSGAKTQSKASVPDAALDRDTVLATPSGRLITSFVRLAADRGYDKVTIIDIVSLAGMSKRTFYEHFKDKEDCLLKAFDMTRSLLISAIVDAAGDVIEPVQRIRAGMGSYVDALTSMPDFTRLFLNESMSAGPELADRWIEATEMMAAVMHAWREETRLEHPDAPALSLLRGQIVILGLNEAICMIVYRDGVAGVVARRDELVDEAIALLMAA
jgi:AcrR family transcriptional regulator